jgi:hypothetical protein
MTITIPLTHEEEATLTAIANGRGVSPDAFIMGVVKEVLERSQFAQNGEVQPEDRVARLNELFTAFDSVSVPGEIREEAFHRENWYR